MVRRAPGRRRLPSPGPLRRRRLPRPGRPTGDRRPRRRALTDHRGGPAMTLALCCMSHSPLLELTDPGPELTTDVESAFATAREFVRGYDPDLVVVFAPDHYNGFF